MVHSYSKGVIGLSAVCEMKTDFFATAISSTTYPVNVLWPVLERVTDFLSRARFQEQFTFFVESGTHYFNIRMLIVHSSSHVFMPHDLHHRCQVPGICQYAAAEIMSGAVHDKILWKSCLFFRCTKLLPYICQVVTFQPFGQKEPSFAPFTDSSSQKLPNSITHWDHSSTVRGLLSGTKIDFLFPVEILNPGLDKALPGSPSQCL